MCKTPTSPLILSRSVRGACHAEAVSKNTADAQPHGVNWWRRLEASVLSSRNSFVILCVLLGRFLRRSAP